MHALALHVCSAWGVRSVTSLCLSKKPCHQSFPGILSGNGFGLLSLSRIFLTIRHTCSLHCPYPISLMSITHLTSLSSSSLLNTGGGPQRVSRLGFLIWSFSVLRGMEYLAAAALPDNPPPPPPVMPSPGPLPSSYGAWSSLGNVLTANTIGRLE